jgi:hypothetical protein
MPIRAKFKVTEKTQISNGTGLLCIVKLSPVSSGSPENESFYRYTPSGQIELSVVKPETSAQFELGKEYYVDFTLSE